MKIGYGCISNDEKILQRVLGVSEPQGHPVRVIMNPPSATIGLNQLLDEMKDCDAVVLLHQDVWLPAGFVENLPRKLSELPEGWVVAGCYGIATDGDYCGHIHDRRVPRALRTHHPLPQPALSLDECCLVVNLHSGYRFPRDLKGFDLYGTWCCLDAVTAVGGSAWIIDCPIEHYATRPIEWQPGAGFFQKWQDLHMAFPGAKVTSTVYNEHNALILKDKFKGQTAWIIGGGPSVQYLKAEDIGSGPVFALNLALSTVQALNLPNPLFSVQKDGGLLKDCPATLDPYCFDQRCDECMGMVRPNPGVTLLVHKHESRFCFPNHHPRFVFDWADIGLPHNEFTFLATIKLAQMMGCTKFYFISFDAHTCGDLTTYLYPEGSKVEGFDYEWGYKEQRRILPGYIKDLDYRWFTPTNEHPIEDLTGRYRGQTCYIVGKGGSLQHLSWRHFDTYGPVIAINEAIVPVESFGLTNHIYSLQKDGGMNKCAPRTFDPSCDNRVCDHCPGMVRPNDNVKLILSNAESAFCFRNHPERYIYDHTELDLNGNYFSLIVAIRIAQIMGCGRIVFLCCDAHAGTGVQTFIPTIGMTETPAYLEVQKRQLPEYLEDIEHEFRTPSEA